MSAGELGVEVDNEGGAFPVIEDEARCVSKPDRRFVMFSDVFFAQYTTFSANRTVYTLRIRSGRENLGKK